MTLVDFVMPSLGADMDSGTITRWMIETGDTVDRGDIVAIVETDKADIDIEVWDNATVAEILVPPGQPVPVGTPLAKLRVDGPPPPDRSPQKTADASWSDAPAPVEAASPPVRDQVEPTEQVRADGVGERLHPIAASPLARRLATERGVDLARITGSGPGGAVTAADLDSAVDSARPDTPEISPMRRAIADLLARSKREIPHYYLATDIDLEAMFGRLSILNEARSVSDRILPAAVLLKAVAVAAAEHGPLNGFWIDDRFEPSEQVHLGVAVSLRGGGLVAPAIHDADRLTVDDLMARLRDLVGRARAGRLRGSEMTDPTITVSNLGDRGVDLVHGVIYPPQVALVGLGRVSERAAVVDGSVVARRQVTVSLSADHRASDGQIGARLLNTIDRLLQNSEALET